MARTYKRPSIVSGKSVQDILNMDIRDFNRLELSDLREVVGRLVSAGNKRLRAFEKSGEDSPAARRVRESGGKFSTRGKTLNQLRAEFVRAKNFLESKTGSLKEWKRVKKNTMKELQRRGVDVKDIGSMEKMWKVYERLKEVSPEIANKKLKYSVLREIADITISKKKSIDSVVNTMQQKLNQIYEEQAEKQNGVAGFFEID